MQKQDAKNQKKLSLNAETLRNLKAGQTAPSLMPTDPPGCSGVTWGKHCHGW